WAADLCGGRDHLAALRRRVLACARPVLPPLAPLRRPADRRRLGVPGVLPPRVWPALLDRPGGRGQAAPAGRHRPDRRRAGPRAAGSAARWRAGAMVRVRRRLRLRPAHLGPDRRWRGGAGAAGRRPLLLRPPPPTPP